MVQTVSKMVKNDPKCSKVVKMIQNVPIWSNMIQNGQKLTFSFIGFLWPPRDFSMLITSTSELGGGTSSPPTKLGLCWLWQDLAMKGLDQTKLPKKIRRLDQKYFLKKYPFL